MIIEKEGKLIHQLILNTVKPKYNGHNRDPKIVVVVDRWSLFKGSFCTLKVGNRTPK